MGVSPILVSFHLAWFSTEPWLWEKVQALWPLGWLACVVLRPSGCIRALPSPPSNRRRKRRRSFWEGCKVATKAGMVLWPYENPMLPISGWWVSSELLDSLREYCYLMDMDVYYQWFWFLASVVLLFFVIFVSGPSIWGQDSSPGQAAETAAAEATEEM